MAAYGQEEYISEAIESLQDMTMTDWEVVIVDDGSPDAVMSIAEKYATADNRIRLLHTNNHGVGTARNTAVSMARGQYLTFLDGDDKFYPDYLSQAVSILDANPDVTLVYGMWEYFGNNTDTPPLNWYGYGTLLLGNTIHISAVIRRADFEAIGGFDSDLPSHEDWDLWIRLLRNRPDTAVCFLPTPSLLYRQKATSRNTDSINNNQFTDIATRLFSRFHELYIKTFNGLILPRLISLREIGAEHRWAAWRPLEGLSAKNLCLAAREHEQILQYIISRNLLSMDELYYFCKMSRKRFLPYLHKFLFRLNTKEALLFLFQLIKY
ncbi:MAG: glycosyltransferase family 2 protein [Candidatus Amulumruptor caecigallinarius]|nr:glycosyltransferase family 2 protein [Candidatus Amulumruptor caecigallinarius]MCM1397022.1 glycosyltransferase family 2 protein [Candidatus Amulumruptor caecigallinarius]MCM1454041.1 glycosyltransferase family 2 protein [bacterium]